MKILLIIAQFILFNFCFSQEYFEKIAESYDRKTKDEAGLNFKLAESDCIFFNHNGIVAPQETVENYTAAIHSEEDMLNLLHTLEKRTVEFGIKFLELSSSMKMLDAGCGAGGSAFTIHQVFPCAIEGITLSNEQMLFANKIASKLGCQDRVQFFQGNMLQIDRKESTYDCIWACESTEHVPDLDVMFQEFARVSKPHSKLLIIAWCAHDPLVKQKVDAHYITQIHTAEDYLQAAASNKNWTLLNQTDLTGQTAIYWKLRSLSKNATGSEKFMEPGFSSRNLQYHLFLFQNNK